MCIRDRDYTFPMAKTLSEVSRDAAELEEVWDNEIQKRIIELRSGKIKTVPLDEVCRKIETQIHS